MRLLARVAIYALIATPVVFAAAASGCGGGENSSSTQSSASNAGGGLITSSSTNTGGAGNTGSTGSMTTSTGSGPPTAMAPCQGHIYACGDLVDNDMDGLIDSQDPDCLGPCDNTEDSYYGGIPGQNNSPCKSDCYFDQDTGSGNDDCYWSHSCDMHEVSPDWYPETQSGSNCKYDPNANTPGTAKTCAELDAMQSNACLTYCGPLTPNGCDCFGCCELPAGGGNYVWLGSTDPSGKIPTCDIKSVADPTLCHPCHPVPACLNGCGHCELCIGKDTLPPDCFPDAGGPDAGGGDQCDPGVQTCGLPGQGPCPLNYYCITGCCQKVPA